MTQPFSRQDIQEILNNFSIAELESNFPTAKLVEEKGSMSAVVVAIFDATIKVAASGCNGAGYGQFACRIPDIQLGHWMP